MKRCGGCGEEKGFDEFHRDKGRKDGRRSRCKACVKEYCAVNRDERREYQKNWRAKNPDYDKEKSKRWREAYPDYNREYYAANREKRLEQTKAYYSDNREKRQNYNKKWREANPEKVRENSDRRRARKAGAPIGEAYDISDLLERYGFVCHLCGGPIPVVVTGKHDLGRTVDHIIPLSRGGAECLSNVQVAHRSCNAAKKDRLPEELPESLTWWLRQAELEEDSE